MTQETKIILRHFGNDLQARSLDLEGCKKYVWDRMGGAPEDDQDPTRDLIECAMQRAEWDVVAGHANRKPE